MKKIFAAIVIISLLFVPMVAQAYRSENNDMITLHPSASYGAPQQQSAGVTAEQLNAFSDEVRGELRSIKKEIRGYKNAHKTTLKGINKRIMAVEKKTVEHDKKFELMPNPVSVAVWTFVVCMCALGFGLWVILRRLPPRRE